MSGHFATLLRDGPDPPLQDHDVYITDWHSARDVPLTEGVFGLDDFTEHLMTFSRSAWPPRTRCRDLPALRFGLAATAHRVRDKHPASPASPTLMAGPIDTRVLPTKVNEVSRRAARCSGSSAT